MSNKVILLGPCKYLKRFNGCSVPHRDPEQMARDGGAILIKEDCPHYGECDESPSPKV